MRFSSALQSGGGAFVNRFFHHYHKSPPHASKIVIPIPPIGVYVGAGAGASAYVQMRKPPRTEPRPVLLGGSGSWETWSFGDFEKQKEKIECCCYAKLE